MGVVLAGLQQAGKFGAVQHVRCGRVKADRRRGDRQDRRRGIAQRIAQADERLPQTMARGGVGLFGPEQVCQFFTPMRAVGFQHQIRQQPPGFVGAEPCDRVCGKFDVKRAQKI